MTAAMKKVVVIPTTTNTSHKCNSGGGCNYRGIARAMYLPPMPKLIELSGKQSPTEQDLTKHIRCERCSSGRERVQLDTMLSLMRGEAKVMTRRRRRVAPTPTPTLTRSQTPGNARDLRTFLGMPQL